MIPGPLPPTLILLMKRKYDGLNKIGTNKYYSAA